MAGTTTRFKLPYPTGTDRVVDGDNAIRGLAESMDVLLAAGAVSSNALVIASGWSMSAQASRKCAGLAFVDFTITRTGGTISVGSDGNIANTLIATFAAGWVPVAGVRCALGPGATGTAAFAYAGDAGITIGTLVPGLTLVNGTAFSFLGSYPYV